MTTNAHAPIHPRHKDEAAKAMEQVKAEPVAWMYERKPEEWPSAPPVVTKVRWSDDDPARPFWNESALYATPQPAAVDGLVGNKVVQRAVMASTSLGAWMSAALDDPAVCDAMKADIQEWFSAGEPVQLMAQALAQIERKPDADPR